MNDYTKIFCPICLRKPIESFTSDRERDALTYYVCENKHKFFTSPMAVDSIFWTDIQTKLTHCIEIIK